MKKIVVILLFSISVLAIGANTSFAQKKEYKPIWALVGYGISKNVDGSWGGVEIGGPFKVTVGGAIWKYIAMELAIDTSWGYYDGSVNNYSGKNSTLWSLDLKPYFLVHQPIGTTDFAVIPYVGVAPLFGVSGFVNDQAGVNEAEFQVGVAAKGGLRFQIFRFLNVGMAIEYTYHRNYNLYGPENRDMFTAIFEAGFMF